MRNDGCDEMDDVDLVRSSDSVSVTLYYFCDETTGPERYIAATIWQPPAKDN